MYEARQQKGTASRTISATFSSKKRRQTSPEICKHNIQTIQRSVIDARGYEIPDEHLHIILCIAAKELIMSPLTQDINKQIGGIIYEYSNLHNKVYVDDVIMELMRRLSPLLMAPNYHVNIDSQKEDVKKGIASSIDDNNVDYHDPKGEYLSFPIEYIREDMREDNDSELMWVMDTNERVRVHKRHKNQRTPHPTLIGGINPVVISGGTVSSKDGSIMEIRDDSGHFRPGEKGAIFALSYIRGHNLPLSSDYKGFRTHNMSDNILGYGATFKAQWLHFQSLIDNTLNTILTQLLKRLHSTESARNHSAQINDKTVERINNLLNLFLIKLDSIEDLLSYRDANKAIIISEKWNSTYNQLYRMSNIEFSNYNDAIDVLCIYKEGIEKFIKFNREIF